MLNDPKFAHFKYNNFTPPSEEYLAMLDIPTYRDVLELDRRGVDSEKLISRKKHEDEIRATDRPEAKPEGQKEKKVWDRIKDIFRKNK